MSVESVRLAIETGEFPADAWFDVEIFGDRVEVVEVGCFADVAIDWGPCLEWAAGCSLQSCPPAPPGWRFAGLSDRA